MEIIAESTRRRSGSSSENREFLVRMTGREWETLAESCGKPYEIDYNFAPNIGRKIDVATVRKAVVAMRDLGEFKSSIDAQLQRLSQIGETVSLICEGAAEDPEESD